MWSSELFFKSTDILTSSVLDRLYFAVFFVDGLFKRRLFEVDFKSLDGDLVSCMFCIELESLRMRAVDDGCIAGVVDSLIDSLGLRTLLAFKVGCDCGCGRGCRLFDDELITLYDFGGRQVDVEC